jgi:hypothetical protein
MGTGFAATSHAFFNVAGFGAEPDRVRPVSHDYKFLAELSRLPRAVGVRISKAPHLRLLYFESALRRASVLFPAIGQLQPAASIVDHEDEILDMLVQRRRDSCRQADAQAGKEPRLHGGGDRHGQTRLPCRRTTASQSDAIAVGLFVNGSMCTQREAQTVSRHGSACGVSRTHASRSVHQKFAESYTASLRPSAWSPATAQPTFRELLRLRWRVVALIMSEKSGR